MNQTMCPAALQEVWKHIGPYASPALHQTQQLVKPVLANLPPSVTDAIANANKELQGHLQGHEPLTVVLIGGVGMLLLLRLLGVLKRFTTMVMMGLAAAYVWPYAQEHFFKK